MTRDVADVPPTGNQTATVRLFNLAPDIKRAGMASSTAGSPHVADVKYGLGSQWESFEQGAQTFSFFDDTHSPAVKVLSATGTPARPPIGSTQFLLGLLGGGAKGPPSSVTALSSRLLHDAPEGGVCKPTE